MREGETKTSVYGASLLSGLLYCAYCNSKLVGAYAIKNRANGQYYRPIYRDYKNAITANHCGGQSCYSAKIIEALVWDAVQQYFTSIKDAVQSVWNEQVKAQLLKKTSQAVQCGEREVQKLQNALEKLRDEVIKSLVGESLFSAEMLRQLLDQKQGELDEAYQKLSAAKLAREVNGNRSKRLHDHYINVRNWADVFDEASIDEKKMILSRLIERITVDRNYNIKIYFYIALDDFKQALPDKRESGCVVVAEETDTLYSQLGG